MICITALASACFSKVQRAIMHCSCHIYAGGAMAEEVAANLFAADFWAEQDEGIDNYRDLDPQWGGPQVFPTEPPTSALPANKFGIWLQLIKRAHA